MKGLSQEQAPEKSILALDPGSKFTGWAIWDCRSTERWPNGKLYDAGKILNGAMADMLTTWSSSRVVIEEPCIRGQMNIQQTVLDTCTWMGIFLERRRRIGREAALIKRAEIHQFFLGVKSGPQIKGADAKIRHILLMQHRVEGLTKDEWQACALAIVYKSFLDAISADTISPIEVKHWPWPEK